MTASNGPLAYNTQSNTQYFFVQASADASVMPRVMQVFTKFDLIPSRWHSSLSETDELQIDVQVRSTDRQTAQRVAALLRQIIYVDIVLTSEASETSHNTVLAG